MDKTKPYEGKPQPRNDYGQIDPDGYDGCAAAPGGSCSACKDCGSGVFNICDASECSAMGGGSKCQSEQSTFDSIIGSLTFGSVEMASCSPSPENCATCDVCEAIDDEDKCNTAKSENGSMLCEWSEGSWYFAYLDKGCYEGTACTTTVSCAVARGECIEQTEAMCIHEVVEEWCEDESYFLY
ncbi:MAG: hypothetical protein G01um101425_363 [Candidatus Peregrinibacteria bacterium Gr01-1014_25]|nr:MAG: hypothetical protein G01um101425_363 [Candidatus Peregrinibacteria bacterium Gr01-1014_25]